MNTIEILNVTLIEPRLKHPTIFERFDALVPGDAFIIHNDHDPKPLYFQLLGERGDIFNWEYLENGPEWWKVKISKRNTAGKPLTVGEIVAADYRKAEIFKKHGIDFCCGGKKSLQKVCREKGMDVIQLEAELNALDNTTGKRTHDFASWDPAFLADYIVNTHHKYVLETIPVLYQYLEKVSNVHGHMHPETVQIFSLFKQVAAELNHHMIKEEEILFPYIKQLVRAKKEGAGRSEDMFGSVAQPIRVMEHEHDLVGNLMKQIAELSSGFTPPQGACGTYRVSYGKLKEFEEDLHEHIHLENNILFPAAIILEQELGQ